MSLAEDFATGQPEDRERRTMIVLTPTGQVGQIQRAKRYAGLGWLKR
jgi:hypothetical protein